MFWSVAEHARRIAPTVHLHVGRASSPGAARSATAPAAPPCAPCLGGGDSPRRRSRRLREPPPSRSPTLLHRRSRPRASSSRAPPPPPIPPPPHGARGVSTRGEPPRASRLAATPPSRRGSPGAPPSRGARKRQHLPVTRRDRCVARRRALRHATCRGAPRRRVDADRASKRDGSGRRSLEGAAVLGHRARRERARTAPRRRDRSRPRAMVVRHVDAAEGRRAPSVRDGLRRSSEAELQLSRASLRGHRSAAGTRASPRPRRRNRSSRTASPIAEREAPPTRRNAPTRARGARTAGGRRRACTARARGRAATRL